MLTGVLIIAATIAVLLRWAIVVGPSFWPRRSRDAVVIPTGNFSQRGLR